MGYLSSFLIRDNGYKRAGPILFDTIIGASTRHVSPLDSLSSWVFVLHPPGPWASEPGVKEIMLMEISQWQFARYLKKRPLSLVFHIFFQEQVPSWMDICGGRYLFSQDTEPWFVGLNCVGQSNSSRSHFQIAQIVKSSSKDTFYKSFSLSC